MRSFVADVFLSALLSVVSVAAGVGLISALPDGAVIVSVFFPPLLLVFLLMMYGGPLALLIVGLMKRRFGLFLGPIFLVLSLKFFLSIPLHFDAQAAASLDQRNFSDFQERPELVILDANKDCDVLCQELIATSNYKVVAWNRELKELSLYKKLEGPICRDRKYNRSHLTFIQSGYANLCTVAISPNEGADAVVVHENSISRDQTDVQLPDTFRGLVFELLEHHAGGTTVLGRWVYGDVRARIDPTYLLGAAPGSREIGRRFARHEFYSAALRTPLTGDPRPGRSDLAALLNDVEPILTDAELQNEARNVFLDLVRRASSERPELLPPRISRLLASNDYALIRAGLMALRNMGGLDNSFAVGDVGRLLQNSDDQIVADALSALPGFPASKRDFAKQLMVNLVFSPRLADPKSRIVRPLLEGLSEFKGFSPEQRAAATNALGQNGSLSEGQRRLLVTLIACGGPTQRTEAAEAIFSLQGEAFARTVAAVDWLEMTGRSESDWTESEIAYLVDRTDEVPNSLLKDYSDSFRFRSLFDQFAPKLLEIIKRRLDVAESAEIRDQKEINALKQLIYNIPEHIH